jgi:hypothetical protein
MATEQISARAITTNLTTSVEQQLAHVRAQITELQEAETVLVNVLTTLRASAAIPEPRAGESTTVDVGKAQGENRASAAAPDQAAPARGGRRRGPAKNAAAGPAAGRPGRRGGKASGKAEPEPVRVLRFLLPLREPQTAAEIARGIYQVAAGPSEINRVRSAAESLTRRGALEKIRQGTTVYYQVADAQPGAPADAKSADEPVAAAEG